MSEKQTHTQGPWHSDLIVGYDGMYEIYKKLQCGNCQTVATTPLAGNEKELRANARLIAAAPEMYEQCKLFEKCLTYLINSGDSGADLERDNLRAILDKVKGETA
jgi:hypothetical protein